MAIGPLDYTVQVAKPFESAVQGFNVALGMQDIEAKRQAAEQARLQQDQARLAQQQMQADLAGLASKQNPTGADYASIMTKYPQLSEHFKRGWDVLSADRQAGALNQASQVYAALQSGRPEIATQLLNDQAAAHRNSGNEAEAKGAETMARFIELDPTSAKAAIGLRVASAMGPEKFEATFKAIGSERRADEKQPAEVREGVAKAGKAESEATIKGEEAKVAPQTVLLDLQKKGWDIKKIQAEIANAREDNRIKLLNVAIAREGNELKRDELKLKRDEAIQKKADATNAKVAEVESARGSMDNLLNSADRFLSLALDKDGKPTSTLRAATGPVDSRIPTVQQDVADLEALLETLGSQAFMAQVPNMKGLGQLSNAEGEKLQASLQNLKLSQSPEQLIANVKEAQRLILKGRKNLATRYGVPDSVPDTPAVAPSAGEIDALVNKYTR